MAKRRMGLMLCLLCLAISLLPRPVAAVSTAEATAPIDTKKTCTLTLTYGCDGQAVSGMYVSLYRVADVSEDYQYTLTSSFASSGLILNGIQTQDEWNVIRSTLESHVYANSIRPTLTSVTSTEGQVNFELLTPGLYLAMVLRPAESGINCIFDTALIALPGLDTNGQWQYRVSVTAKSELLPPIQPDETIELKVLKLWKGDRGRSDRPKNVEVEIFRDGVSYQLVTLSQENQWSYSWTAEKDGATWTVAEPNVPKGYTVTVSKRGTAFVLTNTRIPDPSKPTEQPTTGDTSHILLYTVLLYASGIALVLTGISRKRNDV